MIAIKPVRTGKTYKIEIVLPADPICAHNGYLVYDNPVDAIDKINRGVLIGSWSEGKRNAVLSYLQGQAEHWKTTINAADVVNITNHVCNTAMESVKFTAMLLNGASSIPVSTIIRQLFLLWQEKNRR